MLGSGREGPPVYAYDAAPGVPPVSVSRVLGRELPRAGPPAGQVHSHEFFVLAYFERGGGSLRLADHVWPVEAVDAYVVAPGELVGIVGGAGGLQEAVGWTAFFPQRSSGPRRPEPSSPGAPTRCCSRLSGERPGAPSASKCHPPSVPRGPNASRPSKPSSA